jgi:hypothetical protein
VAPAANDEHPQQDFAFAQALARVSSSSGNFLPGNGGEAFSSIRTDPGFVEMCNQAASMMNTCRSRQRNMHSVGTQGLGTHGQAGAFDQSAALYGRVVAMCRALGMPGKPGPPALLQTAHGTGVPPAPAAPATTVPCQILVWTYVAAAQANDGPRAVAGYNALKQAGACSVLSQVSANVTLTNVTSAASDPRGPSGHRDLAR